MTGLIGYNHRRLRRGSLQITLELSFPPPDLAPVEHDIQNTGEEQYTMHRSDLRQHDDRHSHGGFSNGPCDPRRM
ncbi:hypothetical protein BDW42DRAFT_165277 [Aspergillus taichungensis]|uniref:Uncharacterized protein n=1 Tax=Aspergillus taichungensis TaxID=482145 RepID=A0A2J5I001_9EURO|nr:hypothetical protein BDW42DRAFT_165277 [Aspergillus taichungensis]